MSGKLFSISKFLFPAVADDDDDVKGVLKNTLRKTPSFIIHLIIFKKNIMNCVCGPKSVITKPLSYYKDNRMAREKGLSNSQKKPFKD